MGVAVFAKVQGQVKSESPRTRRAKIQNRINKKSGMEILLLCKFFGHVIKNLDSSGFSHPSFWSCDQKLGW